MTVGSQLHRHLLTLDAHLDVSVHFRREGWSFGERHDPASEMAQMDLPRMEDGNLSGGFFVVYTAQGPLTAEGYASARATALKISDDIDTMLATFPDRIGAARTAEDARRLHGEGRLVAFKSMENSYCLGEDIAALADFYHRGVRLAGPVHGRNNQLADSSTDTPRWNGLSPLGRDWVAEMNRLGIVIDASHASDDVFDQLLALSTTPLLLSHSGTRTAFDTLRNLDDGRLRALAQAGGVIAFTTIFLSPFRCGPDRLALFSLLGRISDLSLAEQADLTTRWYALNETEPMWDADFEDYMAALLHVIEVAGIDHVCFGADWDGGGGVPGLEEISALPRITERLLAHGLTETDIAKLWSGNMLRVLDAARLKASAEARQIY